MFSFFFFLWAPSPLPRLPHPYLDPDCRATGSSSVTSSFSQPHCKSWLCVKVWGGPGFHCRYPSRPLTSDLSSQRNCICFASVSGDRKPFSKYCNNALMSGREGRRAKDLPPYSPSHPFLIFFFSLMTTTTAAHRTRSCFSFASHFRASQRSATRPRHSPEN